MSTENMNLEKWKVADLREQLEKRGLDTKGTKPFLVERLKEALEAESEGAAPMEEEEQEDVKPNGDADAGQQNGQANGDMEEGDVEIKKEKEEEKPKVGVKRKFGEVSQSIEELKPWIVREDEPELKEDFVCLDWYNSDLNLRIKHDDMLSGMPLNRESWSWIYAGARATHGVKSGKAFFEVKFLDNMRVTSEKSEGKFDLRVGWSTNSASRQLGEDDKSWCYSTNEGKKAHNSEFSEYAGTKADKDDVIGAYLDMSGPEAVITFTKNGESMGEAFRVSKSQLRGEALFPHVLTRNIKMTCIFGKDKEDKDMEPSHTMEGYTQIGKMDASDLVRGVKGPATREECEFIMMVGLPAAGKTTWAKQYAAAHPNKRYEILNANNFLDKGTVWGESRKKHTEVSWEKVHHRVTKAIQEVVKVASQRRRNIILDQTNVYVDAQVRKARPFEKFIKKCVVIVPTDEEWNRRREKQNSEDDQTIPDDALNEMKANIAFPLETSTVFDEVLFPELSRQEAQALLEQYNKKAQEAGFGKKHEEYQKEWEKNKKMRGGGRGGFGRGGAGGQRFQRGGGGMMNRGGGFRGGRGGMGFRGGFGGPGGAPPMMPMYGGGSWGPYGGGNFGGGHGGYGGMGRGGGGGAYGYPGSRNWGGWGR